MLGAIVGDIIGSRYEFANHKSKDFPLFDEDCRYTDDSILTIAVADALLTCRDSFFTVSGYLVDSMQWFGKKYPDAGWTGFSETGSKLSIRSRTAATRAAPQTGYPR